MAQEVVSVRGFAVPVRLVSVTVPVADCVELESLCSQGASLDASVSIGIQMRVLTTRKRRMAALRVFSLYFFGAFLAASRLVITLKSNLGTCKTGC